MRRLLRMQEAAVQLQRTAAGGHPAGANRPESG